jgi:HEAT repeat protein
MQHSVIVMAQAQNDPWVTGDPDRVMETAKAIIGGRIKYPTINLEKIASGNAGVPRWSRIAAIYALGFAKDATAASAAILRQILGDQNDDVDIRAHAAEALGNLADRDAIMLLKDILGHKPPEALRESCQYALEELEAA